MPAVLFSVLLYETKTCYQIFFNFSSKYGHVRLWNMELICAVYGEGYSPYCSGKYCVYIYTLCV